MIKKTLNYLLPLLLPFFLFVSCDQKEDTFIAPTNEAVNLTISLKVPRIELTRGVSDDPRNENLSWSQAERLADGRELYHVTLFLIEETTKQLVGIRDIEYGSPHISDGIEEEDNKDEDEDSYGANGFSEDGTVNIHAKTGTEVTFNFLYDHPRHGDCEKLRRGNFKLLVVANHTARGSYTGLTDNGTSLEDLVNEIKEDFDIVEGAGVDDFFDTYSEFFDFKIHAGTDGLCSQTNPQPLTLVQDIALNPGDNYVEAELKRTYSRIRLKVMNNSSSVELTVNSLSFSNNFTQQSTYLFDDPDQPDRKYTGFTKSSLDVESTNALTSFSDAPLSIRISSDTIVFDAYILESRDDEDEGYYYTMDVEYEGKQYELPSKIASEESTVNEIESRVVSNIADVTAYFLIKNTSSGKYLYDNGNWLYQGANRSDNSYEDNYLWALLKRDDDTYYFYNKGTGKYIGRPNGSTSGQTAMVASHDTYYNVFEYDGALCIQANGNANLCLNNWAGNGTHLGGYSQDGGGMHQFYMAQPGGKKDAQYTNPILLETIDPVTAQVSQVKSIKRNDFIDVLITVAYDEGNGDFEFVVVPWSDKKAEIEFN